ncbi:hypothetical protein F4679DRAFT_572808 [Xylaria curta]|nr:hypothetical protein F4679DRAFT_572808 [Xylaria curta]
MHMETKSFSGLVKRPALTGWRKSAKVNCTVLLVSSVVLAALVIVALARGSLEPLFFYGAECSSGKVTALYIVLHIIINIVSTLVILNAPTRQEVDHAHLKCSWLAIGVPSVRNVFHVSSFKTWCWILLLLSSIPIHLLFNSAVFQMDRSESDFHLTIATEKFLHGGDYFPPGSSLALPGLVSLEEIASPAYYGWPVHMTDYNDHLSPVISNISTIAKIAATWERLEIAECKAEYVACRGLKRHRSVVLVVDKEAGWVPNDIWQLNATEAKFWDQYVPSAKPNHLFYDTQCVMAASSTNGAAVTCRNSCASPNSFDVNISYCLAEPLKNICHVGLSPILLLGVALCVIVKTITASVVTILHDRPEHKPLVTLGDAVASFIEHPDPVTAGFCTINQKLVRKAMRWKHSYLAPGPKQWTRRKQTWAATIPVSVWIISYALFASGIITGAVLLYEGLSTIHTFGSFLASDTNPVIPLPLSLIEGVLLANSPQLLLSFCFLAYNNLFTRLQMAKEWTRFGEGFNSLRVTEPRGQQYSTYRLQLPYKYSVSLIVAGASLHWLLSNTIYVFVSTGGYFPTNYSNDFFEGDPSLPTDTAVAVGYSPPSLVVMIIVSSILIAIPPVLTFKRLASNITQPGNNSLAISAACHSSTISRAFAKAVTAEDPASTMPSSYTLIQTHSSVDSGVDLTSQRRPIKNFAKKISELRLWFSEKGMSGKEDEDEDEDDDSNSRNPLRTLAQSRLRWGTILMPAEWYNEYHHDGPVEHLGFGVEEDEPKDPVPGHMYA